VCDVAALNEISASGFFRFN